jgi:molybdopterin synthase catalytic subunit
VEVIRLLDVRDSELSVDEVLRAVRDAGAGGTVVFVGTVRAEDGGRVVSELGYAAHPRVTEELRRVAGAVAAAHPVRAVAAVHRVGELAVGDVAVVVAVACPHRDAAFLACRQFIDELKASVPIWKRQLFADGTQEWVGAG